MAQGMAHLYLCTSAEALRCVTLPRRPAPAACLHAALMLYPCLMMHSRPHGCSMRAPTAAAKPLLHAGLCKHAGLLCVRL